MTFSKPFGGNVPVYRDDMARRRLQQNGELTRAGGYWWLRWHEDHINADGECKRGWSRRVCIGPCDGPGAFTKKQAQRMAWENFLSRLDQNNRTPQSIMTVRQFVERKFVPEHVVYLKRAGKDHYQSQLPFVLGGVPDDNYIRIATDNPDGILHLFPFDLRRKRTCMLGRQNPAAQAMHGRLE